MIQRFPRENNLWYPLPPDYAELSPDGQRMARLYVMRIAETPQDVVLGWNLFRNHYLGAAPEDDRLPAGFFYKNRLPSPPAHFAWIHQIAASRCVAIAAPRYSAKSVVVGTEYPMYRILNFPFDSILLMLSKDDFVEIRLGQIQTQIEENPLILADFGEMKTGRGIGSWTKHYMTLRNKAVLHGSSVESKVRGLHPAIVIFDDVEQDLIMMANIDKFLGRMENLLFTVALPMLDAGSKIAWIGTLDHLRSFLYYVVTSKDPRLAKWTKMIYRAIEADGSLFWEAKWSKARLNDLKEELGPYAFNSQFLNNPISEGARLLRLDRTYHTYEFDGPDPATSDSAIDVPTTLVHRTKQAGVEKGEYQELEVREDWLSWIRKARRFITVDYAPTQEEYSDYSVVHVMAQAPPDVIWSLDLFVGKVPDTALIEMIWKLGWKWRVEIIGVEAVSVQQALFDRVNRDLREITKGSGWAPAIVPIKYAAGVSKPSRIMGLEWRFNQDRIKLPAPRLDRLPYSMLVQQIVDFTPDMRSLQKDDALDTLAMASKIVPGGTVRTSEPVQARDLLAQLRDGKLFDPRAPGMPIAEGIPTHYMPADLVRDMVYKEQLRKFERMKNQGRR